MTTDMIRAFGPGRVNIIGDHTDYAGGLVLPMAIELGTTLDLRLDPDADLLVVTSADELGDVTLSRRAGTEPTPLWGRIVRSAASLSSWAGGGEGRITSTLPIGSGLSSSTALFVAAAVAFGLDTEAEGLVAAAQRCRAAEEDASGVPSGLMDQLASLGGQAGHALLIDCSSYSIEPIPVPEDAVFVVAHCGEPRLLASSAYAERRAQCDEAASVVGPLAAASVADVKQLGDASLRRRARHVISENERVRASAEALRAGDLPAIGRLMDESHASLADDFEVSTPALDSLVEALRAVPGVHGARLTGAGFGGCAVAVADADVRLDIKYQHWVVHASGGAWRQPPGRR